MSFCSPLWLISASAVPALKVKTAKVVADNAMSRILPLLRDDECIFLSSNDLRLYGWLRTTIEVWHSAASFEIRGPAAYTGNVARGAGCGISKTCGAGSVPSTV